MGSVAEFGCKIASILRPKQGKLSGMLNAHSFRVNWNDSERLKAGENARFKHQHAQAFAGNLVNSVSVVTEFI